MPAAKVLSVPEAMESEQVKAREFFGVFTQEECGLDRDIKLPKAAFQFQTDGPQLHKSPPRIGEDTDNILASLSYSVDDIAAFKEAGVI